MTRPWPTWAPPCAPPYAKATSPAATAVRSSSSSCPLPTWWAARSPPRTFGPRIADISLPGVDLTVTASVGLATYPDHATSAEGLERLADAALYVAKRSGRNRIEIAIPQAVSPAPTTIEPISHSTNETGTATKATTR